MENNNRRKLGTYQICLIALAIVMNVIGGQIALALRLPIYLDSIGTIMIGAKRQSCSERMRWNRKQK